MDKNAIKKFAVWARRELISRVMVKAEQYGITKTSTIDANADSVNGHILSVSEKKQRQALIARIAQKDYEQVMEEVAYTWFNRFSALRFMEVNGYLPTRIRVFTDETGAFKPQILAEAIHLEMDGLDMDKVYALKDANRSEELYKYLLITQCNALSAILPGMFQKIEDYTELLFPDMLLREGSVLEQMVTLIPEADWQDQVQIIGWLYQYYNTEPKDKVFADLKKNIKISKENIPAATQLFTPDWIVRYMVENSLGRLWIEGHPNDALRTGWKYYLDEAEQEPDVQAQLAEIRKEYAAIKPEDIRCVDPCMGSGHILVYMFDVLMQIYEAYGYRSRDAVASIVRNNLYGLDIDDRAAQLAYFSVMMKARQYDSRFFTRGIAPNVFAICESNRLDSHMVEAFIGGDAARKAAMETIIAELHDAEEYGSILNVTPQDFEALYARVDAMQDEVSLFAKPVWDTLLPLIRVAETLAQKYDAVVTNPPYMGRGNMSLELSNYVKAHYPRSKSDLFAVFIERCGEMLLSNGFQSMITQQTWMFINSYAELRANVLSKDLISMAHLGARAFEEIGGEVVQTTSFVRRNTRIGEYCGVYCRLVGSATQTSKERLFLSGAERFSFRQSFFSMIKGSPLAYWLQHETLIDFKTSKSLGEEFFSCYGLLTGHDDGYIFNWYEPPFEAISFNSTSAESFWQSGHKYAPLCKGGLFRRWYGNRELVVRYDKAGIDGMAQYPKYASNGQNRYFREGITWAEVCMGKLSVRHMPNGCIFSLKGPSIFHHDTDMLYRILGYLNTNVVTYFVGILNPTISCGNGVLSRLPIKELNAVDPTIVVSNVQLSKSDWDSFETSWDFKRHPLLPKLASGSEVVFIDKNGQLGSLSMTAQKLSDCYAEWEMACNHRFNKLKRNEEELNRIFIDIYGLQDELTPEVADKDVTVRRADLARDIRSLISYAVGSMMGRYSLDEPGLILAGQAFDERFGYKVAPVAGGSELDTAIAGVCLKKANGEVVDCTFSPDKDGILPIADDEYFEDDIVNRFIRFVEVVYGADTLEDNLRFIADALGGANKPPKDVIRSYFLNDFYADHLKIYQKRPIYWLFDSGKKNGFKALIYMHRYTPDTIARLRTDYVHEQQARYRTAIADLEHRIANASAAERVKLSKQLTKLQDQTDEIRVFEEKIHHLADQMIRIDLDDGVKHNYAIFGDVLAKIK